MNDIPLEGTWTWNDGTWVDFGGDTLCGTYPWRDEMGSGGDCEPNNREGDEDCLALPKVKGYEWNDLNCDDHSLWFICNLPSELCAEESWVVYPQDDLYWSTGEPCEVNSDVYSLVLLSTKYWQGGASLTPWLVDYAFTIGATHGGDAGVALFHFATVCEYFYVGVAVESGTDDAKVVIRKYTDEVAQDLYASASLFTYQVGRFYTLRVELTYTTPADIGWNVTIAGHSVTFTHSPGAQVMGNDKFVGIRSEGVEITAKSLFVSEAPRYDVSENQISWGQCTNAPTNVPTNNPTVFPIHDPSAVPTVFPTSQPTLAPSTQLTAQPTLHPTRDPTGDPTVDPTSTPTPTLDASAEPTHTPTSNPIDFPTHDPTQTPSTEPTIEPSSLPTNGPTFQPTLQPSAQPSHIPSFAPSTKPSPAAGEHYTIIIAVHSSNVSKIEQIVLKALDLTSNHLLNATVMAGGKVEILVSIPSDVALDQDTVRDYVRDGLAGEYGDDIEVEVSKEHGADDDSSKTSGKDQDNLDFLDSDLVMYLGVAVVSILLLICCVLAVLVLRKLRRINAKELYKQHYTV